MFNVSVDLDLTPIKEQLKWYELNTKMKCKKLVKETGEEIVNEARSNLSKNGTYKTGKLSRGINYKLESGGYRVSINVSEGYGVFIEGGTKAHIIRPKRARSLKFIAGGQVVYAMKVKHPGTKAKPFMQPALDKVIPKYIKKLEEIIDEGNK